MSEITPEITPAPSAREVFVLGAGFSKAWYPNFPTSQQLGDSCLKYMQSRSSDASQMEASFNAAGRRFERWLTVLAEPQPYLSEVDNSRQSWWFNLAREYIATTLTTYSTQAKEVPVPGWAHALLTHAHTTKARIITFNYDTLIEDSLGHRKVGEPGEFVWSDDIIGGVPPSAPDDGNYFGSKLKPQDKVFQLRKLHGSIDWFWDERDPVGTSILRQTVRSGPARGARAGRSPFIVPPAFTKSRYFNNIVLRQLWQDAAFDIQQADRVIFMGYSLPLEDMTFAGMLTRALGADSKATIGVADLNPDPVVENLKALGLADQIDDASQWRGQDAIAHAVAAITHRTE